MYKLNKIILSIFIAFCCLANITAQQLDHVLGEIIIEVRKDGDVSNLMKDLSKDASMRSSLNARQIMKEPMNLWVVGTNPNEVNEIVFLNKVIKNNNVLMAQQNHVTQLREIPNDPDFAEQWQYINTGQSNGLVGADIDIDLAWDISTGGLTVDGDSIVVCVIDDGINPNHPDLGDNLWINHFEIPDNGIDDDENGYIDDVRGWSAYADSDDVYVGGGHGTPVAGIVGAQGNNEIGVAGVNWDVKLMIVRGGSPEATALASYAYPYTMRKMYNETNGEKGAFVVSTNASWGIDFGDPADAPIWCDFYNMLGEVGILNFGATINGNTNVDVAGDLPTGCDSKYLVSVTNMNRTDQKVNGAGYGERTIDLGAFGASTYTLTSQGYGGFGGTSGATPHVAGTAALLYSTDCINFMALTKSDPAQAALVIKDCILHGVDPNESLAGITTTGGRLNSFKAIKKLDSTCDDCTTALGGDVGEITTQSGILTWYDNGNIGNTTIRYKVLDDEEWTEVDNVESGFEFSGLVACTSYEFQTKTSCELFSDSTFTYSRVFNTDGCCDIPLGINVEVIDGIATIEWENVSAASNFIVEWRNLNDTEYTVANLGMDNTFIFDEIQDCEFYEIRIKSECDVTNNESEYSEIININGDCDGCTKDFCDFSDKNVSDEWIQIVEIEDVFINESGQNENGSGIYLGQFDIELNIGNEYTINLTPGYEGTTFDEYFSVYIDFNQNGEFDQTEGIFISEQSTNEAVSGTFTIPMEAVEGISRMRVIMRFNDQNGPCDQNGFEYGEIEEYCVNILPAIEECPTGFNTLVTDSTETSLTFELTQNSLVDSYLLIYREKETLIFDTIMSSTSNVITVSDLTKCVFYEYTSGYLCQGETTINQDLSEHRTTCGTNTVQTADFASLSIYPNPSQGDLTIDLGNSLRDDVTIELISNEGKNVLLNRTIKVGERMVSINAQDVPAGLYFLRLTSENQISVKKWVKY